VTISTPKVDTRSQLLQAAETLLAAKGIDGASLREINRLAGQRNASALQYHFGDRNGLVRGVLAKHRADTDPRRHALLDQYEVDGSATVRALSSALVLPLASKLKDPNGGREFLQINAEVFTRVTSISELVPRRDTSDSIHRWHRLADRALPTIERNALHTRFAAIRFAFVELARRAAAPPKRDDRLFTSQLVDLVTALLDAPPSSTTRDLLAKRKATTHR
jgi:AcrR family transcriptional regulator